WPRASGSEKRGRAGPKRREAVRLLVNEVRGTTIDTASQGVPVFLIDAIAGDPAARDVRAVVAKGDESGDGMKEREKPPCPYVVGHPGESLDVSRGRLINPQRPDRAAD